MTTATTRQKIARFNGDWRAHFEATAKEREQQAPADALAGLGFVNNLGTTIVTREGKLLTVSKEPLKEPAPTIHARPQFWYGSQAEAIIALQLPNTLDIATSYSHISTANKNKILYLSKEKDRLSKEFSADNWDEEGAKALSPKAIESFAHFVNAMFWKSTLPKAFPFTDGSVGLIWKWDNKVLTVSINDKRMASFSYISKNQDSCELYGHITLTGSQIPDPLNRMIPCK